MEADFYITIKYSLQRLDNNISKANTFVKKAEALKDQQL